MGLNVIPLSDKMMAECKLAQGWLNKKKEGKLIYEHGDR